MLLYNSTDDAGKVGIEAAGFSISRTPDAEGRAWFSGSQPDDGWVATSLRDWWVVVEMPDEEAERYRHYFEDGTPYLDNYLVPFVVINRYRPFGFGRWSKVS